MAKDPAFLFYPADASEDTQFMNRLERGCYFDLLKAQKKFHRFTIDAIKKVLGKDYELCWGSLEVVLKKDNVGYFIEWADDAIEKRKSFTESRRQNRSRANNQELFIYLMKDNDSGNYKIGSSVNPDRRIIEMQAQFPNIELMYSFGKTAQTTEAELHKFFADKKIFNEFFELDAADIEHMIQHMTSHMGLHMTNHMVNANENGNENIIEEENEDATESKKEQSEIFNSIVADWNLYAEKNNKPKIKTLNADRKRKLKTRLGEKAFQFRDILTTAHNSAFIRDGTWFSFDWVIDSEKNYLKVLEGNYNQNGTGTTKNGSHNGNGVGGNAQSAFAKIDAMRD